MVAVRRNSRLWLRELGSLALRELPETLGAQDPFWSPDSAAIAFWDGRRLRRVGAAGGAVSVIGEPEGPGTFRFLGGTWGTAGTILVALVPGGVFRVAAQGGRFEPALKADTPAGEQDFHSPFFLPDGKSFLFIRHMTDNIRTQLCVWHEGQRRPVLKGVSEVQDNPFYSPEGFVLYDRLRRGKAIMAVPFSAERCEATGEPFVVLEDATGATVSSDGTLVAVTGRSARPMELVRIGRDGALLGTVGEPMDVIRNLALSRDGSQLAHSGVVDGRWDIWSLDMGRGGRVRITTSEDINAQSAWSPAGDLLAFSARNGTAVDIVARRADGSGPLKTLVDSRVANGDAIAPEWSPDGATLLFKVQNRLKVVRLAGDAWSTPSPWPEGSRPSGGDGGVTEDVSGRARISPNGRFVAYVATVSGRPEVFVRPFPGGSGKWMVSVEGGASPLWSPRGDELFFLAGNTLMVSSVETAGAFRAAKPRVLIDGDRAGVWLYSFTSRIPSYEVTRDAREFLAVRPVGGDPNELLFYENWSTPFRK
jgi:serine/threonine-protein kinase